MEKILQRIAVTFSVFCFLGMINGKLLAQPCSGGTMAGMITPTIPWKTIPCVKGGEYYEFPAVLGNFYTFTFCMAGGAAMWDTQITILDNSGAYAGGYGNDECFMQSDVRYWQAPATGTYRVLINEFNCQSGVLCGTMAYKCEVPFGGAGSTCSNPQVISSLPYSSGGLSTCGFGYDYDDTDACGSAYMNGEDYVFSYNGTAGECISIFVRNTFIYTGLFVMDGCPDVATTNCIAVNEAGAGSPILSNVTLPTTGTYYIVLATSPTPFCTPFDIEIVNCVAVGVGNTCSNAFVIPSMPYSNVGFTTCGFGDEYNSSQACTSPYMDGEDFVFRYSSPGNECVQIELTGTTTRTGFHVLDGCPDSPSATCIATRGELGGNPKLRTVNLALPGDYYIVVSTQSPPDCTPFNFSISPCGASCNRNTNLADDCSAPTSVSLNVNDTICGFTDYQYTTDSSPDLDMDFCGSIENNGWFSFVADSATMTFRMEVGNCLTGFGVQARVFETADCSNFNPVSNCFNPQISASGTIVANGLTPGNTYYLMVDGYAGDDCEFTVYRIGGLLPVVWNGFTAELDESDVTLDWATSQEINNRGFYIQRGRAMESPETNAVRWENIGYVPGMGDDPDGHSYRFVDEDVPYIGEAWFYRIQQVDYDGASDFSEVQAINLEGPDTHKFLSLYPNPASDQVMLSFYAGASAAGRFRLYSLQGVLVVEKDMRLDGQGQFEQEISVSGLSKGLYIYNFTLGTEEFRGKLEILR